MTLTPNATVPQYEFLVHAMLGLGASHLGLLNHRGYIKQALNHRVLAIRSLNERIAKGTLSTADGDAAFAAMLALTFQSGYMSDGMTDFFSMVRGCKCLSNPIVADPFDTRNAYRLYYRI